MSDKWKEVPFEILPDGSLCLIMPSKADVEQEPWVFIPRVKIMSNLVFDSAEMAKQFGGDGIRV